MSPAVPCGLPRRSDLSSGKRWSLRCRGRSPMGGEACLHRRQAGFARCSGSPAAGADEDTYAEAFS